MVPGERAFEIGCSLEWCVGSLLLMGYGENGRHEATTCMAAGGKVWLIVLVLQVATT